MHERATPKVDIAVLPIVGGTGKALMDIGCRWVPRAMFFSEENLGQSPDEGVGLSDELVAVGLFTNYYGHNRNEPVVRMGNLAMIPRGPVETNPTMGPMEVYLMELRSIAGMSGSPVFIPHRAQIGAPRTVSLLGVLLGHYPAQVADATGAAVNSGIGMVAPAKHITEVLDQEALLTKRQEREEQARRQREDAVMDSAEGDSPQERERFLADLQKASRRVPPEQSEPRKR